jgi:hypothetical protein
MSRIKFDALLDSDTIAQGLRCSKHTCELSGGALFYHKSGGREKGLIRMRKDNGTNRTLRGLMGRHLHHTEIFLRDEVSFHA